jgi:putative transport protein
VSRRSLAWLLLFSALALAAMALVLSQGLSPADVRGRGLFGAILAYLGRQPFVLLFLVLAAGYALGRVTVAGVGFGASGGTLVAGLVVSVWAVARHGVRYEIPPFASTIFFNLFMFSVGMKVGPQLLAGLRRDAGKFIALAFLVPILSLLCTIAFARVVDVAPGIAAGIFVGANTATPALGAPQAAYETGSAALPACVTRADALANLSTAFALSYCISMVLFVVVMRLLPRLFGRDLATEARDCEARLATSVPLPGAALPHRAGAEATTTRAYRVENPQLVGRTLGELRALVPMVAVEWLNRGGETVEPADTMVLRASDVIVVYGRVERVIAAAPRIGPEVYTGEPGGDLPETVEVVVHGGDLEGRTLLELARGVGHGLVLNALFRASEPQHVGPETRLEVGDVLRVTGTERRVALLERRGARVVRPSRTTDILTLAIGLALGALLGAIRIPIAAVSLTLGAAVGLLLVGITLSTLRTRNPALGGPFPEPARQLLEDLGLSVFIAIAGINAGPGVVAAVKAGALVPIVAGCLLVGFAPAVLAWAVGQYGMRMNAALLLGAVAGARSNSPAMRAGQEASASDVPAIAFPVAFAISSVLFTFLAYVVALLA